ncbi:serine/threonine-protein phosphatase [Streptomyces sp. SCA3-4]|uniref:PP2C family protein-serine/threonine phosphatase n=1 Tax=Streptomyces sichuanensis TaxID=2871810 RepID=UPI001CE2475F|nr:PP2C family protein-serine/threonine phosphatase [Streptomyces sichuanensis]MCA6091966.1 serine/threonine-protein phosphatase [Streptomyces sichuanensis]
MGSLLRSAPRRGPSAYNRGLFRLGQCVPFAIAVLVVVIEFTPAHFLYTGPLLTATPALAAVTMGPRGTLAAVAVAVAVSVATATYNDAWGTQQVYTNFLALFLVSLAGYTSSSAVQTRRQSELDQVRRIAEAAQEVILRPAPARLGTFRAAGMYLAAEEGAQIGGDLYEVLETRYGVRMIVGDVRGKGLPAVRAAAAVLGAFREAAQYEEDLVEVMNHCTAALRRETAVPGAFDQVALLEGFVTALVAQVPDDGHVVEVVNRGHPSPLVLRRGTVHALVPAETLPPLWLEDFAASLPSTAERHPFAPGDRLLLYTDGVIEARDRDDAFFPLPEAMEEAARKENAAGRCSGAPRDFLEDLHAALLGHTGGHLTDDAAMLLVEWADAADAP